MEISKSWSKKYRGPGLRRRYASKCLIVVLVILVTTWICPSPGAMYPPSESEPLQEEVHDVQDACYGRRIHMYDMPEVFNIKLLEYCDGRLVSWIRFCKHYQNFGFGEAMNVTDWFRTDAYMLEVMFYERMRTYDCLVDAPGEANIFFVPFFAGLDALPYLYDAAKMTEKQGQAVVSWLRQRGEWWARHGGVDHFMVAGRTAWDFHTPKVNDWGTHLFDHEELQNVTFMVLERVPWHEREQAIPYPVGFHPASDATLEAWIQRVRTENRSALFSFTGALRPQREDSIRGVLSDQCANASAGACSRLDCAQVSCSHSPEPIYESLLHADFCLQPRGDTATRRSTIDSIVAGCIPVFFHEDTAEKQYLWHFPEDYSSFSVFVSEECMRNGTCIVSDILARIPRPEVLRMREKLISMIPSVVYRHPTAVNFTHSDAFDLTIEGMSRRVASLRFSSIQRLS